MKAIVITKPPNFELRDVREPECGPEEVVIRTAFCGICGTDLEILRGTMPKGFARYPVIPGHEWTGVVEEIGGEVKNLKAGDRVSVEGYLPCGSCGPCRRGDKQSCVHHEQIGMTQNGGFAQYVAAPAMSCHLVPAHVGLDEALMVEPASTVVRGIEHASPRASSTFAVIGCGPIGLIAARVLHRFEPSNLLGIDLAGTQARMADQAGFTAFTTSQDPVELRERSGSDGWDMVVDCALGAKPLQLAFQIVRPGGIIVAIGGAPDSQTLQLAANVFVTRDLRVYGVLGYTTDSWVRTLGLVSTGELLLGDLISHKRPIEEFESAVSLVEARTEPLGKVSISFT
jgi:2-desacetyl-2-hydroxyethyl bacteriochlorophyllide A dehydrogenase